MRFGFSVGVLGLASLLSAGSVSAGSGCSCSGGTATAAPSQPSMNMSQATATPPRSPVALSQNGQTYRSFSYEGVPATRSSGGMFQRSAPARYRFDASSKALGNFGRGSW